MEEKKKGKKKIIAILLVSLLVVIVIITTIIMNKRKEQQELQISNTEITPLIIEEFKTYDEDIGTLGNNVYITGKIKNLTDNVYANVEIEYIAYGENGEDLGKLKAAIFYLDAKEECQFYAFSTENISYLKINSYSVKNISGMILDNTKIISENFLVSNESIGSFAGMDILTMSYDIKNISNNDYNEPITIVHSIREVSTGAQYIFFHELESIKANTTVNHCFTSDVIGVEPPIYTKYTIQNYYVILGKIDKDLGICK